MNGHTTIQSHAPDFWLARGAVLVTALLNVALINRQHLGPSWLAPAAEIALLLPLSVATAWTQGRAVRASTEAHWKAVGRMRRAVRSMALWLTALVTTINFIALFGVLHALLRGGSGSTGETLLLDAINIWLTNIVVFALWFWNLDRGGPAMRGLSSHGTQDFVFTQPPIVGSGATAQWSPGFIDYLFLAFTNATAFSPTDTIPVTARGKLLMMAQALASLATVGLVAARAVNILA